MQVLDHGEIDPALAGPDPADIACQFPVCPICGDVAIQ